VFTGKQGEFIVFHITKATILGTVKLLVLRCSVCKHTLGELTAHTSLTSKSISSGINTTGAVFQEWYLSTAIHAIVNTILLPYTDITTCKHTRVWVLSVCVTVTLVNVG